MVRIDVEAVIQLSALHAALGAQVAEEPNI
jgi:hypothetical protein